MLRALDLFCGAGGATRGLQDAGFHVMGVDLKNSPRYCGDRFIHGDVLALQPWFLELFDFIWASPPCQFATALKTMPNAKPHANLIPPTRAMLEASGVPYVIENVEGAREHLLDPVMLCGTMFGLGVRDADLQRHRLFEPSFPLEAPGPCCHGERTIGVYGGHYRDRRRQRTISVVGHAPYNADKRKGRERGQTDFTLEEGKSAMQIDWMSGAELSQSIPPAYSEYIARAWLASRVETIERKAQ